MKVLIVCSGNYKNFSFEKNQAFIYDQINAIAICEKEIKFSTFFIKQGGVKGYWNHLKQLKNLVKKEKFDILHAHNSVIGLLSILQRKIPVMVTFHGSDININKLNLISSVVSLFAKHIVFVSEKLKEKIYFTLKSAKSIIPCGVDFKIFKPVNKKNSMEILGMDIKKTYALFSSSFNVKVKNPTLALKAVSKTDKNLQLLELTNKTRAEVNQLLNAVGVLVLTSFSEGSPQIIKEAMACNCPIVSTDVGDVKDIIGNTEGCYITSYEPTDVADKIKKALEFGKRTNGRDKIKHLDNKIIAKKIVAVYKRVLDKK